MGVGLELQVPKVTMTLGAEFSKSTFTYLNTT
jgi:hypothetical protein